MGKLKTQKINEQAFKKYGYIINWNGRKKSKKENLFRIVARDRKAAGWRIAYLIVRDKVIGRLEQHPDSMESFEPVSGKAILYLSYQKKPTKIAGFMLDKPVILKKGIWHGVVSLSQETHIKITENNRVKMRRSKLSYKL